MVDEMEFSVRYGPIYHCDMPDCEEWPTVEVHLIGGPSGLGHDQVCRKHVAWAKRDLARAALARAKGQQP